MKKINLIWLIFSIALSIELLYKIITAKGLDFFDILTPILLVLSIKTIIDENKKILIIDYFYI